MADDATQIRDLIERWANALLRCASREELEAHPDYRLRLSAGLRKEGGRWVVAHEHHSFTSKD